MIAHSVREIVEESYTVKIGPIAGPHNPLPLGEGKGEGSNALALTSILSQRERKKM
jgi:hypothetical protein